MEQVFGIMTRRIFFSPTMTPEKGETILPKELSCQIGRVLRLRKGDFIELRNGKGSNWRAQIVGFSEEGAHIAFLNQVEVKTESPLNIVLGCAVAKSDRLDMAIRQATELGVKKIVIFPSHRSQYVIRKELVKDKIKRWRRIAEEALCQCGRSNLPDLTYAQSLNEVLNNLATDISRPSLNCPFIVASETAYEEIGNLWEIFVQNPVISNIILFIGPEGGWSEEEIQMFRQQGCFLVSLGPRILRYETAIVVAATLCQFLWGDMAKARKKERDDEMSQM